MQDGIRKPHRAVHEAQADRRRGTAFNRRPGPTAMLLAFKDEVERLPSPSHRVLIIEDNNDGRESLQALLKLLGYRVETAKDGPSGLEKALAWRPEVVLLDIGLPGLDGYQVARQLRSAFRDQIRLIAYTGYGRPDDRRRAFETGFDAHLVKPVNIAELCRTLGKPISQG